MKYSLGLTAVTLIAISGLYIAGCSDSTPGMGIIDPFDPDSPTPRPTSTSTASPSPSPTTKKTELFQDKITNPINLVRFVSLSNTSSGFGSYPNYWALQVDKSGGNEETSLLRIADDTVRGRSPLDKQSPRRIKLMNVATGKEIKLNNATCMRYITDVQIGAVDSKYEKVYGTSYNPSGQFLVLTNEAGSDGSGCIIVANPNEFQSKENEIQAHVIYNKCIRPVAMAVDTEYIWWAECKEDGYVYRMDYASRPDEVEKNKRIRQFVYGVNHPTNIEAVGDKVFVADAKNNCVLAAKRKRDKDEPSSGPIYPMYDTNEDWGIWKLTSPITQPYALRVLKSGKLLIADHGYNPFFEGLTTVHSAGTASGRLLIWDCPCGEERKEGDKLGTKVEVICDGLANPMEILPTYDASNDFTHGGKYAQTAELLITQYNGKGTDSKISLFRTDVSWKYNKARLKKDSTVMKTDRTSWAFLMPGSDPSLPIYSTTDDVQAPPGEQKANLKMLYNEKVNTQTNFESVITLYNYKYPF